MRTMRIFTQADENYCFTVRNNSVVLAPNNPRDEYQHWFKDIRHGSRVKDESGLPSFALVNKATRQAIQHPAGARQPVRLVTYNPDNLNKSVLWTLYGNTTANFGAIRMVTDISLNLDACGGNTEVFDGIIVEVWEWKEGVNQKWKIEVWESYSGWQGRDLTRHPTVSIYTMDDENVSLSVKDDKVILASVDDGDLCQHWIKDMAYGMTVKDTNGHPSFALINKATGQAISNSNGAHQPLALVAYNPKYVDQSILWTEGMDMGGGFRAIRKAKDVILNFDAFRGGNNHAGGGSTVGLWEWLEGDNQKWKIVPY